MDPGFRRGDEKEVHAMTEPKQKYGTDNAFTGPLKGGAMEPTYSGALSFMRRRYTRELAGVDAVVWGIPFDQATTNRPGARFGPQAIRRASAIFDGDPQHPFKLDPFETLTVIDYGDAYFDYGKPMEFAETIEAEASRILASGAQLFSLGGDHFVTYPLIKAHATKYGPLALVQFDAHQDTWAGDSDRISHGAFVGRAVREGLIDAAKSIQIGIRTEAPEDCGIEIITAGEIDTLGAAGIAARINERVGEASAYLTFDIDCLDPAFAPGTGTPVAGGLSSREALAILRALGSIDFIGGDVVEVAPAYDHADITAIAASTVAMYYLGLLAERRRG
jgi:agmatinase